MILKVTQEKQAGAFPTVQAALAKAKPGDRIVVLDDTIEEQLKVVNWKTEDLLGKQVTVEPAAGKRVIWRAPSYLKTRGEPLIQIGNVNGFCLKGFTFDGKNLVRDLMEITGYCPGLVVEDVQLKGFTRRAVLVSNCAGNSQDKGMIVLRRITAVTEREAESAFEFTLNPGVTPKINEHILVNDCKLEGPFQVPIRIVPDLSINHDVQFSGNLAGNKPIEPQACPPRE